MHILMLGYFTLNLTSAYKHTMKVQRSESIVIKLRTLIMESSLHWYFLQLVVSDVMTVFYRHLAGLLATHAYGGQEYN